MSSAYDKVMAMRLAERQRIQREMSPLKVGQQFLRQWCGAQGVALPPEAASALVTRVAAIVEAERAIKDS